jgi:hypothetical protein
MLPFTPREPIPSGDDITRADVNVLEKINEFYHSAQNDPEYKPENFDCWLDCLDPYQRQKARHYLTELRQHIQSLVGPFPNNVNSAHRELERAEKRLCEELDDLDEQKPQELTCEQTREAQIGPRQPAQESQASINSTPNDDGGRQSVGVAVMDMDSDMDTSDDMEEAADETAENASEAMQEATEEVAEVVAHVVEATVELAAGAELVTFLALVTSVMVLPPIELLRALMIAVAFLCYFSK